MTDHMEHDPLNPSYYKGGIPGVGLEVIEYTRHMCFTLGNAFKYVARAGAKGSLQEDLGKAVWYLRAYAADMSEAHKLGDSPIPGELLDTIDWKRSGRANLLRLIALGEHKEALAAIEGYIRVLDCGAGVDLDEKA